MKHSSEINGRGRFIFAVHDVCPRHLERLNIIENFIAEAGIKSAAYLLIPDYHASGTPADRHPGFADWCRRPRSFNLEWFLHGYSHIESHQDAAGKDPSRQDRIRRFYYRGGEAEFMGLRKEPAAETIEKGLEIFRNCTGSDSTLGFVAPAWFFHPDLPDLLRQKGFQITEDHHFIHLLQKHLQVPCPVITWATRTLMWRLGSSAGCSLLERLWRGRPLVRVAVHPDDFRYTGTVDSIRRIMEKVTQSRDQTEYNALLE